METLKSWAYKWVGGLVSEDKGGQQVVSLGRVSFIFVLGWMAWYWVGWWRWHSMDPGQVAEAIVARLTSSGVTADDLRAASQQVVDAVAKTESEPPLLQTAFLTLTGYVFGSKAVDLLKGRFGPKPPEGEA